MRCSASIVTRWTTGTVRRFVWVGARAGPGQNCSPPTGSPNYEHLRPDGSQLDVWRRAERGPEDAADARRAVYRSPRQLPRRQLLRLSRRITADTGLPLATVLKDLTDWANTPGHEREVILASISASQDSADTGSPTQFKQLCQTFKQNAGSALLLGSTLSNAKLSRSSRTGPRVTRPWATWSGWPAFPAITRTNVMRLTTASMRV
jgi:hypothetical protein